jgi:hypothetical protein
MAAMARKTSETTTGGKEWGQNGKKGTRDFFPCGRKYHVPFFPVPFFAGGSAREYDAARAGIYDTAVEGL